MSRRILGALGTIFSGGPETEVLVPHNVQSVSVQSSVERCSSRPVSSTIAGTWHFICPSKAPWVLLVRERNSSEVGGNEAPTGKSVGQTSTKAYDVKVSAQALYVLVPTFADSVTQPTEAEDQRHQTMLESHGMRVIEIFGRAAE